MGVVPADIDSVNKQLVAQDIAYIIDSKISANAWKFATFYWYLLW